jgi:hypothetical protein
MELLEVRGKSQVFILLTPNMSAGIKHLLSTRIHVDVAPNSKYVFSKKQMNLHLDGVATIHRVTTNCPGLKTPQLIRSRLTCIRKYLATSTQVRTFNTCTVYVKIFLFDVL